MEDRAPYIIDGIVTIISDQLRLDQKEVRASSDLRDLPGVDSVETLRIVSKIEKHFNVTLDDDVVFNVESIADLGRAVVEAEALAHV